MNIKYFAVAAGILALAACKGNNAAADLHGKQYVADVSGTPVTLAFISGEDRVNGRIVNIYNGTYEIKGDAIKFGPMATTMMMGPAAAMNVEREYLQFLDTVESYSLDGEQLVLKSPDGRTVVFTETELDSDGNPVATPKTMPLPAGAVPVMRVEDVRK